MFSKGKQFWYLYSALVIIVLIRIIPFLYPASRTWGFNHLIFLPQGFTIAFFSIAAVALILPFIKKSEIMSDKFVNWFSVTFFESPRKYYYRAIFVLLMAVLFILFPAPTHFLGDGYSLISIVSSETGQIVKWSERGIYLMMNFILSFFDKQDSEMTRYLYQLISNLSGVATLWFCFLIANYASDSAEKRTLIFFFSVISGSLLLFFGYVEHYSILLAIITGFLYTAIRFLKTDKGILWVLLLFIIGSVLHMLMIILIPSIICLLLISDKWQIVVKRFKYLIFSIIAASAIITIIQFIDLYKNDLGIQDIFLNIFRMDTTEKYYAIFSPKHLLDILNELLIVSPLILVLLLSAGNNLVPMKSHKTILFLISVVSGFVLFLLVIDPKLGMARDWDLFSIPAFLIMFILFFLIGGKQLQVLKKEMISLLIILIISVLPFLMTNLNEASSIKYSESLISLDFDKSRAALFIEYKYFLKKGDNKKADSLKEIYKTSYPEWNKYDSAFLAIDKGDINRAAAILNTAKPKLYNSYYQKLMGRLYYSLGNFDKALLYTNNAIQLQNYLASTYGERALIYFALGLTEEGINDLRHGYKLDNSYLYILDLMIMAYSGINQLDSCIYYAQKRLALDSTAWSTYYGLANAYARKSDLINAQKYAEKMAEFKIAHVGFTSKLNEVTAMINRLKLKDDIK